MTSHKPSILSLLFAVTIVILLLWIKAYLLIVITGLLLGAWIKIKSHPAIGSLIARLSNKTKRVTEWFLALLIAITGWWFIKSYIVAFESIQVSLPMDKQLNEKTWLVGKYQYGAARHIENPNQYVRTHRFQQMARNHEVVFHNPDADSILPNQPYESFYQSKRIRPHSGEKELKGIYLPVAQRPLHVLRVIGLPGENVAIRAGKVCINDKPIQESGQVSNQFILSNDAPIEFRDEISREAIAVHRQADKTIVDIHLIKIKQSWLTHLTPNMLPQNYPDPQIYPFNGTMLWNSWHIEDLHIPAKGETIRLTSYNLILYRHIIEHFEKETISMDGSTIWIAGKPTQSYRFKMNYYWLMGDNRTHSFDSRYFGLVPENHIVGKACIQITI